MRKMPCLFKRVFTGHNSFHITTEVEPEAAWVLDGSLGAAPAAFRKRDGTACAVINGRLFKRYDAKPGKKAPEGAIPCTEGPDEVTGHWPYWVAVTAEDKNAVHHLKAWNDAKVSGYLDTPRGPVANCICVPDGTYELCGPSFSANPEKQTFNTFIPHNAEMLDLSAVPLTFEGLKSFLEKADMEGIVWHHPDGIRKAKLRRSDFGFDWPVKT